MVYKVGINDIDFKARLASPSAAHLMGTDDLGRDLLARMLIGGRISLAVGMAAMLMALTVGVVIGALAGITGGWVDAALMWVTDLCSSGAAPCAAAAADLPVPRDPQASLFGLEVGIFILIVAVIGGFRLDARGATGARAVLLLAREGVRRGRARARRRCRA
ncbi:MAG: hypothetical protein U1F56_09460 [Rubrivivax sp.]